MPDGGEVRRWPSGGRERTVMDMENETVAECVPANGGGEGALDVQKRSPIRPLFVSLVTIRTPVVVEIYYQFERVYCSYVQSEASASGERSSCS
jgi:hypothetical protein